VLQLVRGTPVWTPGQLRALRHGLWLGAAFSVAVGAAIVNGSRLGVDAHAYWAAWHRSSLYAVQPERVDAYLYSPAFAQAIWPLAQLPWGAFCTLWLAAVGASYLWLLAPLDPAWRIPLFVLCLPDVLAGNVWAFFALVLVFGFRYPALWAFAVLTKLTPVAGLVWFAARREWRNLAIAVGTAFAIIVASYAAAPGLWSDWTHFLVHSGHSADATGARLRPILHPPTALFLAVGTPISIGITVFAARRDRHWLVPFGMILATPFFTVNAFAMLTAIPRLRERYDRA
jgi:hypothetical protein